MLLAFVLLLAGVAVGVLRGGSLDNINRVRFRLPWLVFLGLGLQIGAEVAAARFPEIERGATGPLVLALSYGCVGAFVALNVRFPGTLIIGLGLALNLSVILANGAMPVSRWAVRLSGSDAAPHLENSVKHMDMRSTTRLRLLGDIIPVPPIGVVSVGDVVLGAGVFVLVSYLMAPPSGDRSRKKRRLSRREIRKRNGENRGGDNRVEGGAGHHPRPNAPEPPPCSGHCG
ncbi:MAG TPA: DUF5317 domain-containing protein [Actinomycetota bacterium]